MIEIYKSDMETNVLETLTEDQYMAADFNPKNTWVNLVNPSDKEVAFVSRISGVEEDSIKAALDEEERSRIQNEEDHMLILVDTPVLEEEANYYSYFTLPLGTILTDNMLITVTLKDTTIIRDFVRGRVKGFCTYKKTRFLLQILNNIATKYLAYLKQIDKASQRIQNALHKSIRNKELIQMLDLENSLVYFSTSLSGNDAVISRLLKTQTKIKIYEEDEDLLEDVAIDTKQAIEMCTIYRDILSGTMDAYASVISNNLNVVMKVLASITLIMSIPQLLASLFGMNTGVPMEGKSWGFWVVVALSGVISAILAVVFKKKKLL